MTQGAAARIVPALACLLAMGMALFGCGREKPPVQAQSDEKPESQVSGYYAPGQSLRGGSDIGRLNLRDIEIRREGQDLLVIFTFMDGSAQMGMEEKPASGVPLYETHFYPGVDRLMLEFEGLAFWDYRIYDVEIANANTLIQGVFKQVPVGTETTCLYINTRDGYAYRIESAGHQLFLYMRPLEEEETTAWYISADGFGEYAGGGIPRELNMTPSLCDDLSSTILLSAPFATEEEARAFLEGHRDLLAAALPGKTPAVVQLRSNQLPSYDASSEIGALANTPVGRTGSHERTYPAFIENGRFLCWRPGGNEYAFIRPLFLSSSQEDEVYYTEQIWSGNAETGDALPLVGYDFTSIIKGEYSANGRYLAFIEQTEAARMLEIIDTQTGRVLIAAEDNFGEDTADFAWDTWMPRLYAITGSSEAMQMMCYDLTGGENAVSVYALEEEQLTEGDVGRGGGSVFYSQSSPDTVSGSIVAFNLDTGEKAQISTGYSLSLAAGGEWLAVTDILTGEPGGEKYLLKVIRTDGTQETVVDDRNVIVDYVWSRDGKALYYTIYRESDVLNDKYQLGLYRYEPATGGNEYVTDIVTGALYPDLDPGSVLMMVIYDRMGRSIPITYRIAPDAE